MPTLTSRLRLALAGLAAVSCGDAPTATNTPPVAVAPIAPAPPAPSDTSKPVLVRTVLVTGLSNPWDIAFLPNDELLVTERPGRVRLRRANGELLTIAQPADLVTGGEGGMMGMTVDPQFTSNRFVYTCFSSNAGGATDNRVVRWTLAQDGTSLANRRDILTGMPYANGGRHSGCRPRFGPDGYLWVGTGDAGVGVTPQDLTSLGGKVLRLTRDGAAAQGNPQIAGADARIYTYGHRNVQGLSFQQGTGAAFAIEQGSFQDDEVNRLVAGGNAGWNPVPGYNESVPMTDLTRYATAMRASWSSGNPARGTSGGGFVTGTAWKAWNGALVIGQLSGTKLVFLTFDASGALLTSTPMYSELGLRIRTPIQGPDGALYVTTDGTNGAGQIWRITPN